MIKNLSLAIAAVCALTGTAMATEIAVDPGLETTFFVPVNPTPGTVLPPGWVAFANGDALSGSTRDFVTGVPTAAPNSGTFAGRLLANTITNVASTPSSAVLKNANIGIGVVQPNSVAQVSFFARGSAANGGVHFAEFFSEQAGGGASKSDILGGGPLALNPDPAVWDQFSFSVLTGPDVTEGVTLQFVAATGSIAGSTSQLFIDDISVQVESSAVVPVPAAGLLLLTGLGAMARRRRVQG